MLSHKRKLLLYKILVFSLVVVFIFFGKLYNRVPQIEMRAVVTVMGVDVLDDDSVKVSAHVLVPMAGSGSQSIQTMVTSEGDNLNVAIDRLSISNGAKVEVAQCGMLVFGQKACQSGILPFVKSIVSKGDINSGAIMITSDRMEAEEYLKALMQTVDSSSEVVSSVIAYFQNSFYMPSVTLFKFLSGSVGESASCYVPCVELKTSQKSEATGGDEGGQGESGGDESSGGESGNGGDEGGEYTTFESMTNAAVFLDGVRTGVLNEKETRGLIWSQKGSNRGFISTDDFVIDNKSYGELVGEIMSASTKVKVDFKDGKPFVRFNIKADIDILERYRFTKDLDKGELTASKLYDELNRHMETTIKEELVSAVDAMVALRCDFMGLKYRFYRLKNKEMKEYAKNHPASFLDDLVVEVSIKTKTK